MVFFGEEYSSLQFTFAMKIILFYSYAIKLIVNYFIPDDCYIIIFLRTFASQLKLMNSISYNIPQYLVPYVMGSSRDTARVELTVRCYFYTSL